MKFTPAKTLALVALALPMIASAQVTANVSLTSNYKFRGQDQEQSRTSTFKPALQGGFDYAHESGFYVGNWNSSVSWGNATLESDIYGGYKFKLGAFDADVGLLAYIYPGATANNTTELYGALTYGPFTAKYSHTISKDYFNLAGAKGGSGLSGRGTGYFNFAYAQEIAPKTTLKASVGYTRLTSDIRTLAATTYPNYWDYSVGAAYDLGNGFSLSGAFVGANKKTSYTYGVDASKSINKNTLVVTLTKSM